MVTPGNTGSPFFAKDVAEANRALAYQQQVARRQAYLARLHASFRGDPVARITLDQNWAPVREDE